MSDKLNFSNTVEEIRENKIILPDFQRGFTWKEQKKQRALLASVLTKLPLGTVLLLESNRNEYGCRKIGRKTKLKEAEIPVDKPYVLLDGQQRMTTLISFLTDIVDYSDLISPSLARKFFYCIPKFTLDDYDEIFGMAKMRTSESIMRSEYPDFTTNDIIDRIYMFDRKDNRKIIYEEMKKVNQGDFIAFCTDYETDGYLLPMFLLYGACGNKIREHSNLLKEVLKAISKRYISDIENTLKMVDDNNKYNKYVRYLFNDCGRTKDNTSVNDVKKELDFRQEEWVDHMKGYLDSCIKDMEIQEYRLTGQQDRLRAIDIYENMNRGGKALDVFDLLLARAAQTPESGWTLRDKVEDYVKGNHLNDYKILLENAKGNVKNEFEKNEYSEYCASYNMKCWDDNENDLSSAYSKLLVDLVGVFHHFMDEKNDVILYDNIELISSFSVTCTKREYLLDKVQSKSLWKLITEACKAIDRALMFLAVRCGIMSLTDVHYNLMLVILGFVLSNNKWYESKESNDIIEAWYWATIFSGNFRIEQNKAFEKHLRN